MIRSITLSLILFAAPTLAETDQFRSGWEAAHKSTCAPLGLAQAKTQDLPAFFENEQFSKGWEAAHDDVFETMAAVGIADGIQTWCADPWEFYPQGTQQYRFK
ncbi:hypothetical protein [Roseibium alexandrii]|uniref:hypothetical protein n=1 Tax=Roseibium alexandrii TaxID=388408 RepID=UPI003751828D